MIFDEVFILYHRLATVPARFSEQVDVPAVDLLQAEQHLALEEVLLVVVNDVAAVLPDVLVAGPVEVGVQPVVLCVHCCGIGNLGRGL